MSKYRARRTECNQGHAHASKKEAERCNALSFLERGGLIHDLSQQPVFQISVGGRHICKYIADFSYFEPGRGTVIEDAKGFRTPEYKLKKKLVEAIYSMEVTEV